MASKIRTAVKCSGCNSQLLKKPFLQCSICSKAYDLDCAGVSGRRFNEMDTERKSNWPCPLCISMKPKTGNLDTPVKEAAMSDTDREKSDGRCMTLRPRTNRPEDSKKITPDRSSPALESDNDQESLKPTQESSSRQTSEGDMKMLWAEIKAMRADISKLNSTMSEFIATIKNQNARIETLESKVDYIETKFGDMQKSDTTALEATVEQLKMELQDRDQERLVNDVEIAGVPETGNESLTHIVLTVATKLGIALEERDIVVGERVGPVRTEGERPRPIVVRLARKVQRDELLRAARVRRRLTTEGMGLAREPRPFYVNERLTKQNRQLFHKTREMAMKYKWRYVWTREGKIFAKKESGTPRYRLRTEKDIISVFEMDKVGSI